MGQAGSTLCQVFFDDFFVPEAALMGNVNEGWPIVARTLEHSRITIAAQGAGIVERSYDEAERFAGERVQHLTPTKSRTIAEIPRVAQRLAMMQRQRDIVSYLVQKAARHEEMDDPDFAVWGSLAKLVSGETAIWAAYASMLTHGGMGYITETEIAHVFNAAPVIGIYEGTADIQSKILEQYFTDDQILSVLPPQTAHLRDPAHFPPAKTVIKDIDMWTTR
jgi:butyryl-CoA dehydrogenase